MRQVGGTQKTINRFQWDLSMQQVVLIWPCMFFHYYAEACRLYIYIIYIYILSIYIYYIYIYKIESSGYVYVRICTYIYIYICACIYKIVFKPWFLKYVLSEGSWHWHVAPRPVCTGWDCCLLHTEVSAKCRMQLAQLGLCPAEWILGRGCRPEGTFNGFSNKLRYSPKDFGPGLYIYIYIYIYIYTYPLSSLELHFQVGRCFGNDSR